MNTQINTFRTLFSVTFSVVLFACTMCNTIAQPITSHSITMEGSYRDIYGMISYRHQGKNDWSIRTGFAVGSIPVLVSNLFINQKPKLYANTLLATPILIASGTTWENSRIDFVTGPYIVYTPNQFQVSDYGEDGFALLYSIGIEYAYRFTNSPLYAKTHLQFFPLYGGGLGSSGFGSALVLTVGIGYNIE